MLQAVLLDVDGTLFDTERLFMRGWLKASKEKGYPLTEEQTIQFHGRGQKRNGEAFKEWFGEDADYWGTRALRQKYVEEEIAKNGVPVKPGLYEFMEFLTENKIKIALATGTVRPEAQPRWIKADIMKYVDASICGDEVENNKPDPEIFLKAAEKLGVDPRNCAVLEDSVSGLYAAKAAGAHVIMVPDMDPPTDELRENVVDVVCPSLLDVIDYMKEHLL